MTIAQPEPITALTAVTDASCNGVADGAVVITPAGGTAPYTITPEQTGLAAGDHTFLVTDANGCTLEVTVTIAQPEPITALTAVTDASCNGVADGAVVITPAGGTAPYTITPAQTGLAAGDHTFLVTDANGCTLEVTVTIAQPEPITALTAVTDASCNGVADGAVVITPAGGTAPYTITPAQTGLAAGDHTFLVTDANGCTLEVTVTIAQPEPITALTAVTDASCNGVADGAVVITPAGGTAPYTITPEQTGLAAGDHTFLVTDANGCTLEVTVTIAQPEPITALTAVTDASCNGVADGAVVITPAGGTAPYTITPAQTGLAAGDHTFLVTDANGCTLEVTVTIAQPEPITALTAVTDASCNGVADGAVVITPAGGTAPYTITPEQTGLAAGDHTFLVTDANGCTLEVTVTIAQPEPITALTAVTDASCNGVADGAVVITPAGGTAPYTITPEQTGLAAGDHTFLVTDANGCTLEVTVTIAQPEPITALTAVTDASCNGVADGAVVITPAGGTAPYTITPEQTGLAAGDHTFLVTDANGCTLEVTVTIAQPEPITALTAVTDASCNGVADGAVVITPAGGTAPYTITPAQTGLAAGDHTFLVTDANGCTLEVTVTIAQPEPITALTAVTDASCNGVTDGAVVITPAGGTAPYTITPEQTGLAAGDHTFLVTDANGCTLEVTVTIAQPEPITALTAVTDASCNGVADGAVVITPAGGTAPYLITPAQTDLAAGDYLFTVTDANGCTLEVPVTITQPEEITASTVITNVSCFGLSDGAVVITPAGGAAPYTITPAQSDLAAGDYLFTVTDANGCTLEVPVTITQAEEITASTVITNVSCFGLSDGAVVITPAGGAAPYTITPAQSDLAAGDYLFTVTDANGCTLEVPVTITQAEEITASTVITNVSCFGLSDGAVVITPAGGAAPYTITPAQSDLVCR